MMKIAFLSHLDLNLYLFRLPIMKKLVQRGHRVYAVCPRGDVFDKFEEEGVIAVEYDIERGSLNPLKEFRSIYNIYKVIKPLDLDIIHTFTAKPNIYGTIVAKTAKVPVILNLVEGLGSFYVSDTPKNILVRTIMEQLYKVAFWFSDGCVFVNSDDPKYMIRKGIISEDKTIIIKSVGVDTEKFSMEQYSPQKISAIKEKNGWQDKIIVLMVARAIWDKGIREYYDAAKIIDEKFDNVIFVLAGGTDVGNHSCVDESFLRSGAVEWLGHRDDMADMMAVCDIFVLPSYREGLPATLMEATSMSKPIVTTDVVGCRDVVSDGHNGFLVPPKDENSLAEKIEKLIENPQKRKIMGENGRITATEIFDVKKVVAQYMALYEKYHKKSSNE